MKTDQTRVYLWFLNYGNDASIVTEKVGLQPTFICVPDSKKIYKVHKWKLYSPLDLSAHIDDHFKALLRLLEPRAESIRAATNLWTGGINVAIDYEDWTLGIHFSVDVLATVASMNLPIDLDLYFYGEQNA